MSKQKQVGKKITASSLEKHMNLTYAALKIILFYLIMGFAWIISSDLIIDAIFQDHEANQIAQTVKGIFYVAFTALVFFYIIVVKWKCMS